MTVADTIAQKLTEALQPSEIQVIDESAQHAGHAGARPGGESHFHVTVVSQRFSGLSRVARQRLVYAILSEELADQVHALSMTTKSPDEH